MRYGVPSPGVAAPLRLPRIESGIACIDEGDAFQGVGLRLRVA